MKIKYTNSIILYIISILFLLPLVILVLSCFSTSANIKGNSVFDNISLKNLIENFKNLLGEDYFITSLCNSLVISLTSSVISVLLSSMAGYSYVVYRNKRIDNIFLFSVYPILIPEIIKVIPYFLFSRFFGLLDSYSILIIFSISLPFLIYIFRQNTQLFQIELVYLARIDGLNEFGIFIFVYLPLMKNVFIATILMSFISIWNSLLIPVALLQSQERFTNIMFLNSIGSIWYGDYGVLMLGLLLSIIPNIFIFVILQKIFRKIMKNMIDIK
jgi:lactose/L-arabinose transport system permease protein